MAIFDINEDGLLTKCTVEGGETNVTIPDSAASIDECAFSFSGLTSKHG